jgi:hypothetical protein
MDYTSQVKCESKSAPGVVFHIRRMSLARRVELTRRVRELWMRCEFLNAGQDAGEKLEAALLEQEIDRLYLQWGLCGIEGLRIDGEPADTDRLMALGPEGLAREIVDAVKAECQLTAEERKN